MYVACVVWNMIINIVTNDDMCLSLNDVYFMIARKLGMHLIPSEVWRELCGWMFIYDSCI